MGFPTFGDSRDGSSPDVCASADGSTALCCKASTMRGVIVSETMIAGCAPSSKDALIDCNKLQSVNEQKQPSAATFWCCDSAGVGPVSAAGPLSD